MNILKILDILSDDALYSKSASRTESLSQMSSIGKKTAAVALPLGLGAFFSGTAKAETEKVSGAERVAFKKDALTDALQLALVLEYLEDEYYTIGTGTPGLIPSSDLVVFQQIRKHETAHVAFLKAAITSLGATPGAKPNFDFTASGAFTPFTNYQQFLILAQAFEDTGVRAYKGQAGNVMGNKTILQAALQIHSVEARHASQVRRMRMNKGWIELNNCGNMPSATDAVYAGEEMTTQAGFNTGTAFGNEAGSASFDEILTGTQAQAIASLFID